MESNKKEENYNLITELVILKQAEMCPLTFLFALMTNYLIKKTNLCVNFT